MATVELTVAGVNCDGCASAVTAALEAVDGVCSVKVSLDFDEGGERALNADGKKLGTAVVAFFPNCARGSAAERQAAELAALLAACEAAGKPARSKAPASDMYSLAKQGAIPAIKALLASSADGGALIGAVDAAGNSMLYYACLCGQESLVGFLLASGAKEAEGHDDAAHNSEWKNALTPKIRRMLEAARDGGEEKPLSEPKEADGDGFGSSLIDDFCEVEIANFNAAETRELSGYTVPEEQRYHKAEAAAGGVAAAAGAAAGAAGDAGASATYGPSYAHNVMFLCNHNSCRSQMADGWLRALRGGASVGVASAGIVGGTAVKPGATLVMKEAGLDISGYSSDAMANFEPADFDVVVSCCGCGDKLNSEKEVWKQRDVFEDWALDDPPATDPGDFSEYRRVRDEVKAKVEHLLEFIAD